MRYIGNSSWFLANGQSWNYHLEKWNPTKRQGWQLESWYLSQSCKNMCFLLSHVDLCIKDLAVTWDWSWKMSLKTCESGCACLIFFWGERSCGAIRNAALCWLESEWLRNFRGWVAKGMPGQMYDSNRRCVCVWCFWPPEPFTPLKGVTGSARELAYVQSGPVLVPLSAEMRGEWGRSTMNSRSKRNRWANWSGDRWRPFMVCSQGPWRGLGEPQGSGAQFEKLC